MALPVLIKCTCGKLLCKTHGKVESLEIKCARCKKINTFGNAPPKQAMNPGPGIKKKGKHGDG